MAPDGGLFQGAVLRFKTVVRAAATLFVARDLVAWLNRKMASVLTWSNALPRFGVRCESTAQQAASKAWLDYCRVVRRRDEA
jgi:hypothetical protein